MVGSILSFISYIPSIPDTLTIAILFSSATFLAYKHLPPQLSNYALFLHACMLLHMNVVGPRREVRLNECFDSRRANSRMQVVIAVLPVVCLE